MSSPSIKPSSNASNPYTVAITGQKEGEVVTDNHRILDAKFNAEKNQMTYTVAPKGFYGKVICFLFRKDANIVKAHQEALAHQYKGTYDFSFPENKTTQSFFPSFSSITEAHPERKGSLKIKDTPQFLNSIKKQQFEKEYEISLKKAEETEEDATSCVSTSIGHDISMWKKVIKIAEHANKECGHDLQEKEKWEARLESAKTKLENATFRQKAVYLGSRGTY
ncbi:MAG: hypothetical protein K2W99_06755 [Chthoniobacterales bacterium]|nr:hypothetical protein [Chthoniobacterales bacterium]